MILGLQQGFKEDGIEVSLVKLCEWFGVARRTVYYRATKGQSKLQEQFVKPIKTMIEENPSFGYRTVGFRPRIQALPSVTKAPNERGATDLCRIWAGKVGWSHLALVKSYGLQQEFIMPFSPEQNVMVERVIRALNKQCAHRH